MKNAGFFLAYLFLVSGLSAQSGWTREPGQGYIKAGALSFASAQYYNLAGDLLTTSQFRQQALSLYGEYGLSERFTVIGSFPLLKINSFETTEAVAGIGDLHAELKYALLKGGFPVSLSIAPELPTGSWNNYAQNKMTSFERINLPTGDGELNVWGTLAASHSFYPFPAYVSVYGAFNYRTGFSGNSFRNQFKTGVEVGYQVKGKLWLNARLAAQKTLGQPGAPVDFIRGDGTEYTSWGFGAAYSISSKISATLEYQNYSDIVFARKNLYSGHVISVGASYEWKREE
ncbi:MAG: hypothetical protein R3D00_13615 [Bacteroidia bacterium]